MGEHKEVIYERLYLRVPGTDKLRKNAAGRLRHLINTGWRETERFETGDYVRVRLERSGHLPPKNVKLKEPPAPPPRERRGGFGQRGGPGGGFRGGGGPRR